MNLMDDIHYEVFTSVSNVLA